jgi:hypothetical protein
MAVTKRTRQRLPDPSGTRVPELSGHRGAYRAARGGRGQEYCRLPAGASTWAWFPHPAHPSAPRDVAGTSEAWKRQSRRSGRSSRGSVGDQRLPITGSYARWASRSRTASLALLRTVWRVCRMCAQVSLIPYAFAGQAISRFSMVGRSPQDCRRRGKSRLTADVYKDNPDAACTGSYLLASILFEHPRADRRR